MIMYDILKLALFASWVNYSESAVALQVIDKQKESFDGCWVPSLHKYVAAGETWQEQPCGLAMCMSYSGQLYIEQMTCGSIHTPNGCTTSQNSSLNYPDCCPKLKCSTFNHQDLLGPEYDEFEKWIDEHYEQ